MMAVLLYYFYFVASDVKAALSNQIEALSQRDYNGPTTSPPTNIFTGVS